MSFETPSNQLRWGILGTGNIARQFAAGMKTSARTRLAAVGSRTRASADVFGKTYGVPRAHGTYEELLSDDSVDAVYVSLPNSMHHEWTLRALSAGKHVLCEKPIASNADEAKEMFDAAKQAGRILMEAFMYRSHPLADAISQSVRSGEIGQLKVIRTSFCFRVNNTSGNIRFDPKLAGGSLMDVGCYCLNFSRWLAGSEPTRFDIVGNVHSSGVDDYAAGTLAFGNGVVASFTCGMTVQAENSAWVCGSDGYLQIPVPWKPSRQDAQLILRGSAPPKMEGGGAGPPEPIVRNITAPSELYALEADDFAAAVLDGAPVRITEQDSLGNMRLLDAMRRKLGVPV